MPKFWSFSLYDYIAVSEIQGRQKSEMHRMTPVADTGGVWGVQSNPQKISNPPPCHRNLSSHGKIYVKN